MCQSPARGQDSASCIELNLPAPNAGYPAGAIRHGSAAFCTADRCTSMANVRVSAYGNLTAWCIGCNERVRESNSATWPQESQVGFMCCSSFERRSLRFGAAHWRTNGAADQITRARSKPSVAGPVEKFTGRLFEVIFERDNLDWQSREVATVSMLSALQARGVTAAIARSHQHERRLVGDRRRRVIEVERGRAARAAPGRMPAHSSKNFQVSAPSNLRTRTEAINCGSKFPRRTPCRAPAFTSIGSQ